MYAKILGIRNLKAMSNGQGPAAEGVAHKLNPSPDLKHIKSSLAFERYCIR